MMNKWAIPLKINLQDKWLDLGKDIWGMIFKMCIGENVEEYNKYHVVIIRCTCKKFSEILTPKLCLQMIYDDPKANTAKYICYMMDQTNENILNRYRYKYINRIDLKNENVFYKFVVSEYCSYTAHAIRMRNKYRGRREYFLQLKLKWCCDNGKNKIFRAPGEHLMWKIETYFIKHKLWGIREHYINPYSYLMNWIK